MPIIQQDFTQIDFSLYKVVSPEIAVKYELRDRMTLQKGAFLPVYFVLLSAKTTKEAHKDLFESEVNRLSQELRVAQTPELKKDCIKKYLSIKQRYSNMNLDKELGLEEEKSSKEENSQNG